MPDEKYAAGDRVTLMRGTKPVAARRIERALKRFFVLNDGTKWDFDGREYPRRHDCYVGGRAYVTPWKPEHTEQLKLEQARIYVKDRVHTGDGITPEMWLRLSTLLAAEESAAAVQQALRPKEKTEVEDGRE